MLAIEIPATAEISSWLSVSVLYSGTALDIYRSYVTYLNAMSSWQSEQVTRLTERRTVLRNSKCAVADNKWII
jgi:hypothetical protein